ncbi:MAG: hypothetical protein WC679_00440 [Bacteroidales bacterium]|jgi:hypothetical protein
MDSRFALNTEVIFQPDVDKIDWKTGTSIEGGVLAKIVAITFGNGKLLYDLAIQTKEKYNEEDDGFYYTLPFRQIDSVFVCPKY